MKRRKYSNDLKDWTCMLLLVCTGIMFMTLYSCHRTPGPAQHAVSSKELQKAMKELYTFSSKDISEKLYVEMLEPTDMSKIEKAAADMAKTADGIPRAIKKLSMDEQERAEFVILAEQLRDQSRELSTQANRKDLGQARATMNKIKATCNACHTKFRIPE